MAFLFEAGMLVGLDDHGVPFAPGHGDGHELVGEAALVHGGHRPAVAFHREGVLIGAADLHVVGDVFGGLAQADDGV